MRQDRRISFGNGFLPLDERGSLRGEKPPLVKKG